MIETNILIAGIGPAGAAASYFLSNNEIVHHIIDKSDFPRDKTCGDALSGKVLSVLRKMNPKFENELLENKNDAIDCWGVKFVAPNGKFIDVPFKSNRQIADRPPGFISKRIKFDHFLFTKLSSPYSTIETGVQVVDVLRDNGYIIVKAIKNNIEISYKTSLIIAADGAQSIVAKKLGLLGFDDDYYSAGIRCYYKNVKNLHPENYIELHFLKNVNPGYLWIFPLPNNEANVGIGIPKRFLTSKNRQLKTVMFDLIQNDQGLAERFKDAELISEVKGWGLPLGNVNRKISGDNFILTGDSAQLIDPFTGEGIGNALMSGMMAAEIAAEAIRAKNFSRSFLKKYDEAVYSKIGDELKLSDRIQKLASKPWLFNFVVHKANKSKSFKELLVYMFENIDIRSKLSSPLFYIKLLFNR